MKKELLLLALSLTLMTSSIPAFAESVNEGKIYSDEIQGDAAEKVIIPIYIDNNPGLEGYVLNFSYDPEFIEPEYVEQGIILEDGNFNDDIEGSTSSEGEFKVLWNHSEEKAENGALFYLHCNLNSDAYGESMIQVGYDETDTYNGNYDEVMLAVEPISITAKPITPLPDNSELVLPGALTQLDEFAFEGIHAKSVFVPDSCKVIGDYAFMNSDLKRIRIPDGCSIEKNAFYGCKRVLIFGAPGSDAENYCENHSNCIFVKE